MNILITTIFAYPHEGGLSTHVSTLKKGLEGEDIRLMFSPFGYESIITKSFNSSSRILY